MVDTLLFYVASVGLLLGAILTVTARSPLRSALWLVVALMFLALHFVLLDAGFVAAMQILVYAGAIMVLFLFVIMLLNLGPEGPRRPAYLSLAKVLGSGAVLFVGWRAIVGIQAASGGAGQAIEGTVKGVGRVLVTDYLFAFEAISVLLLVAVVGGVVLGLKRLT